MNRSYEYRLYPTRTQRGRLHELLRACRTLYNAALQERREAWKRRGLSIDLVSQCAQLKTIRAAGDPLAQFSHTTAIQVLRRVDNAFRAFFRRVKTRNGKAGYPRFKGKHAFTSVACIFGDGVGLRKDRLHLTGIAGGIKIKWHRPLPAEARIKMATVKHDARGRWAVCFQIEMPDTQAPIHAGPAIGLDVGLHALLATSDGDLIDNPRWYRAAQAKLAKAQRVLARRTLRSTRWRKQRRIVAHQQEHTATQRKDFLHQVSTTLTRQFALIAVEDLRIQNLVHGTLAKSIHDAGWGMLRVMLTYKAVSAGGQVIAVAPQGTSQQCSRCGATVRKDLAVRQHQCPACGLTLDRDVNAARNILARALASCAARTEPSVNSPALARCSREAPDLSSGESSRQWPADARSQRTGPRRPAEPRDGPSTSPDHP
jgi:putative transposase